MLLTTAAFGSCLVLAFMEDGPYANTRHHAIRRLAAQAQQAANSVVTPAALGGQPSRKTSPEGHDRNTSAKTALSCGAAGVAAGVAEEGRKGSKARDQPMTHDHERRYALGLSSHKRDTVVCMCIAFYGYFCARPMDSGACCCLWGRVTRCSPSQGRGDTDRRAGV